MTQARTLGQELIFQVTGALLNQLYPTTYTSGWIFDDGACHQHSSEADVVGMRGCGAGIGCSTIDHGDSIEKMFQLNDAVFDSGEVALFCRAL